MKSLYTICLEFCIPRIETYSRGLIYKEEYTCKSIEDLGSTVAEDLLHHAFNTANKKVNCAKKIWKEEWKIFFTSKISSAILKWDSDLINYISNRCKNLKKCKVIFVEKLEADLVLKLPKSVITLDFDGELIERGRMTKDLMFQEETLESWLSQAQKILKALEILKSSPVDYTPDPKSSSLSEVHLGKVQATASDLKVILKNCKNLQILINYQMVTALYELHVDDWKKKLPLPKYKLKNLDVDFSHVVRCRMSPEWVLSPDALQLATALCPSANSIRVRFDCSTPNYVLNPLLNLTTINEFSAVCVSSGERTLLDFSDMSPIFEKFGPTSLNFLELKVIEEVEIHVIIEYCTKIETLILSGCGYVTPTTCSTFNCQTYEKGSFKKLAFLFYADGDDFSWDHGVPECFWKASLCPSGKTRTVRLQGLFLEFPRMSPSLAKEIFHPGGKKLPFPELKALSFCRFEDLTVEDVVSICGITSTGTSNPLQTLKYIRLSDCDKIVEKEERRLRKWLKYSGMEDLKLDVDR